MTVVVFSAAHAHLAPAFSRRRAIPARRNRRAPACPPALEGSRSRTRTWRSAGDDDVRTDVAVGIGGHTRTGGEDVMDEARVVDPYGLIQDIMSSPAHTLTPGLELDDPVVRQSLDRHHGLPVVSAETGQAVGVLSRADVKRIGEGNTQAYTVGDVMSSPPICVRARAHIAEAAGVMLQHKVHRLPVVDDRNVPVGIATRQDVFEPLIAKRDDVLVDQATRRYMRKADSSSSSTCSTSPGDGKNESGEAARAASRSSSTSQRRVRVAAKPFTSPFAFRRDSPLTRRSPSPGSPAAECGEAEEAQAKMRARKLAEGFEREDERWALELDVDGA
jgi:CBS domain-containing protein